MQYRVSHPFPARRSLVQVGSIQLPRQFTVDVSDDEGGGRPDLRLTFEVRDGAPQCRQVQITATDNSEVRGSELRSIRVEDILEQAVKALMIPGQNAQPEPGKGKHASHTTVQQVRTARTTARRRVMTNEMLREVARVYREHLNDRPTAAVAEHFGRSLRAASLYVKQARQAGLLGAALKGKAGER